MKFMIILFVLLLAGCNIGIETPQEEGIVISKYYVPKTKGYDTWGQVVMKESCTLIIKTEKGIRTVNECNEKFFTTERSERITITYQPTLTFGF